MKNALFLIVILLVSIFFSQTAFTQDKKLPFPQLPASIEEAEHKGQKGCMPSDQNYYFAVSENEGLVTLGAHSFVQTPTDGAHSLVIAYNEKDNFGYMLSNKGDGNLCISEKLKNFSMKTAGSYSSINYAGEVKLENCNFTKKYTETCGTFKRLSAGLTKNGFKIDWQAVKDNNDIITMLSGKKKTYILTTDRNTGATVITGSGKGEFEFINVPNK